MGRTTLERIPITSLRRIRVRRIPDVLTSTPCTSPRRLENLALRHTGGIIM